MEGQGRGMEGQRMEGQGRVEEVNHDVTLKKNLIRKKLREIKHKFRGLKFRNSKLPEEFKLKREEFELDPSIRVPLREKLNFKLEEVHLRNEYEDVKSIVLVNKIQEHFLNPVETLHIIVRDISHETEVDSFRSKFLSKEFEDIAIKNRGILQEEFSQTAPMSEFEISEATSTIIAPQRLHAIDLIGEFDLNEFDIRTIHAIRHLEDRLRKKYERETRWADLMTQQVPDNWEDPEDVTQIKMAQENLGDYKLKSKDGYSGEKITIAGRRQRLIDLKIRIYERTKEFNSKIYALREEKKHVLKECKSLEAELILLQKSFPREDLKEIPPVYNLTPEEEPENQFKITQEQIEARQRIKIDELNLQLRSNPRNPPYNHSERKLREGHSSHQNLKEEKDLRIFRRDTLLSRLHELIKSFKEKVQALRNDRMYLAIDLKLMGIKYLVLVQELDIAKEFEEVEKGVLDRLKAQKVELIASKAKMGKIKKRMHRAEHGLSKIEESLAEVQKDVKFFIGKAPKFSDYLWKVFRKRIRPETNNETAITKLSTSSCSDSDSSATSTSQDSGSDLFKLPKEKFDINICPQQLDKVIYDRVCDLRIKKLNFEIEEETQKQALIKVRREFEAAEKVYRKHEGRKEDIGNEIESLRKRKQDKINQIQTVVILRAHQVLCVDQSEGNEGLTVTERMRNNFPPNLNEIIIFPKHGITALEQRVAEVKEEMILENEKHNQARVMIKKIKDKLGRLEKNVAYTEDQCKRDMIHKFGRVVDLDDLCAGIINLDILAALKKVEAGRNQKYRTRELLQKKIREVQERLISTTRENSTQHTLLAILTERQRNVDYFLYKQEKRKQITEKEESGEIEPEEQNERMIPSEEDLMDDIYRLEEILLQQYARLEMLRNAVRACRTKSGLPPLVPFSLIPNEIPEKFITQEELQYIQQKQEYLQGPMETMWAANGQMTERLMTSTSKMDAVCAYQDEEEEDM